MSQIELTMKEVLKKTPFSYKINNKLILIIALKPKIYALCDYVYNTIDGKVVTDVSIYVQNLSSGVSSNSEGYFSQSLVFIQF